MASLRLTFPEKEEPTIIALTGARLTIGRLPFNTIQIIDRTVSGFHAELISEHGHYRLHDRGSSNGTFVNGQKVSDFHLSEACTITFGTVEAQFSPEAIEVNEEAESFPTRSEINAVRKENVELKSTVEALREEANALRLARPLENGDVALAVTKEEYDKVVVEREGLKEERLKQDEEITRLKTDLAVLKRDRVNLQLAYDGLQREITDLRAKAGGVEEIALPPKAAAAALAAQAPQPGEEVRVEVPVPAASPIAKAEPAPTPEPPAAVEPPEVAKPFTPPAAPALPKAPGSAPVPLRAPSGPIKPFAPLPKAPALAATATAKPVGAPPPAPAGPVKAPPGLGSGIRPLVPKPTAVTAAPADNIAAGLSDAPTTRIAPRPLPTVKLPAQPTVKMAAVPLPKVGPKGTQKLS
jgi:pSer/pThr/pTyr-binding forkhead associated (FHA) protein